MPVNLMVIIFTERVRDPSTHRRQQRAQPLKSRQLVMIKAILAEVFVAVIQLGKNNSVRLFLFFKLMWMNAWKVKHMCEKVVMFSLAHVEDGRAVAAGEFIFLKPKATLVATVFGMVEHQIPQAFAIDFASLHHQMHVHEHLALGGEAFSHHEESDPQKSPKTLC